MPQGESADVEATLANSPAAAAAVRITPAAFSTIGFAPGVIIGGRYRIVSMLGRGGMGEVYRADDLRLGQVVALKFLPSELQKDEELLRRFHQEVKQARQLAHPNICRVYDIGEAEGRHFFTMEHIDGEDLGSLLRRIGRLPETKAIEIAHQLCSALAAAHRAGLLHRDIKPANIMLDGRGRARITDFGLALSTDNASSTREISGTPAYMAPEQLTSGETSIRSDLYSLGLVLYELFTGRPAFVAKDSVDLKRLGTESTPRSPSTLLPGIDPAVDRAIMRCLQSDPLLRPESALHISAAFPGGDPLLTAIAAGETPSPETVAHSGETRGLDFTAGTTLLVIVAILLVATVWVARRGTITGFVPLAKTTDGITDRTQEFLKTIGYDKSPADSIGWFQLNVEYLKYLYTHVPAPSRTRDMKSSWPGPYLFVYRQSQHPLTPLGWEGAITLDDPPMINSEMITVVTDGAGHLLSFRAVPPVVTAVDLLPVNWEPLISAVGVEKQTLRPVEPSAVPKMFFDKRSAWEGTKDGIPVRIQAAEAAGKPVYLEVEAPWGATEPSEPKPIDTSTVIVPAILALLIPGLGAWFAFRNLRRGTSDTSGAKRIAIFVGCIELCYRLFIIQRPQQGNPAVQVMLSISIALFAAAIMWLVYVGLEPLVRRWSPRLLVTWTRVLQGKLADAQVGRDVLLGVAVGGAVQVLFILMGWLAWAGYVPATTAPLPNDWIELQSTAQYFGKHILLLEDGGVLPALWWLLLVVLVVRVVRVRWVAATLVASLFSVLLVVSVHANGIIAFLIFLVPILGLFLILVYLGPVAFAVAMYVSTVMLSGPANLDPDTWYFSRSALNYLVPVALAVYGYWAATITNRTSTQAQAK